jgi:hypothetical protein
MTTTNTPLPFARVLIALAAAVTRTRSRERKRSPFTVSGAERRIRSVGDPVRPFDSPIEPSAIAAKTAIEPSAITANAAIKPLFTESVWRTRLAKERNREEYSRRPTGESGKTARRCFYIAGRERALGTTPIHFPQPSKEGRD